MKNTPPLLSINTLAFHGHDFPTAFREIATLGVEYGEPAMIASYYPQMGDGYFRSAAAQEMLESITDHGLKVAAMGGNMSLGRPEALDGFRRRMELARLLGARVVHADTAKVDESRVFLENLEALIPMIEKVGGVHLQARARGLRPEGPKSSSEASGMAGGRPTIFQVDSSGRA